MSRVVDEQHGPGRGPFDGREPVSLELLGTRHRLHLDVTKVLVIVE